METTKKRGPGRPATGERYRSRLMIYTDQEGKARLQRLAERWGVSAAEAMRRLIDEAAKREGM